MTAALTMGAKVEIEVVDDYGVIRSYQSSVRSVSDRALTLDAPLENHIAVHFRPGAKLLLTQEAGPQSYVALVEVVRSGVGSPSLVITTPPRRMDTVPRRRYFRVETNLACRFDGGRGRIRDLSGNGMLVAIRSGSPTVGQRLEFHVDLPGTNEPLPARGRVVRLVEVDGVIHAGVQFTRLAEGVRDSLISYVLGRQRELMRLGLLSHERAAHDTRDARSAGRSSPPAR